MREATSGDTRGASQLSGQRRCFLGKGLGDLERQQAATAVCSKDLPHGTP